MDVSNITSFLEVAFVRVWANPSGVIVYSKDNSQPVTLSQGRVHWTLGLSEIGAEGQKVQKSKLVTFFYCKIEF